MIIWNEIQMWKIFMNFNFLKFIHKNNMNTYCLWITFGNSIIVYFLRDRRCYTSCSVILKNCLTFCLTILLDHLKTNGQAFWMIQFSPGRWCAYSISQEKKIHTKKCYLQDYYICASSAWRMSGLSTCLTIWIFFFWQNGQAKWSSIFLRLPSMKANNDGPAKNKQWLNF